MAWLTNFYWLALLSLSFKNNLIVYNLIDNTNKMFRCFYGLNN